MKIEHETMALMPHHNGAGLATGLTVTATAATLERLAQKFAKAFEKNFDRSFVVRLSEKDGKYSIETEIGDTGAELMTIADLAVMLQTSRAQIREMLKGRAQRGPHPVPFIKLHGKMIRFMRSEILNWIATTPRPVFATKRAQEALRTVNLSAAICPLSISPDNRLRCLRGVFCGNIALF